MTSVLVDMLIFYLKIKVGLSKKTLDIHLDDEALFLWLGLWKAKVLGCELLWKLTGFGVLFCQYWATVHLHIAKREQNGEKLK